MTSPRVALFSDSHYEANGVARTTGALESYAQSRALSLLSVHAGPTTRSSNEGSVSRLELRRSQYSAFRIEHDLQFDVLLWRHLSRVMRELRTFRADVLHFTGPSDIGLMGAYAGCRLGIPLVGSWHTNLHEYASRRLHLAWLPGRLRRRLKRTVEQRALDACMLFYRIPHVVLAPNSEWQRRLEAGTGRPSSVMSRGVNIDVFTPARRTRNELRVNLGYVGRLSPEKSVRVLADLDRALEANGLSSNVRFTIVGDGSERRWLQQRLPHATFTGVLRGDELATAYANMDLLVFPSQTETVGNVVLEALASGVPVVAMAQGGPQFVGTSSESTRLAVDHEAMIATVCHLVRDNARRQAMKAAARNWAVGRSWDSIFHGVYQVYVEAIAMNARSKAVTSALSESERCVEG